jgi:hypothetical protein
MGKRAFTFKSLIFGLLGLLVTVIFPQYSGNVLGMTVDGGYLPTIPLFFIVLISLAWNMTAGRISRKLAVSAGELAVILGIMLVVSWIPSVQTALVRQTALALYEELTTNANWEEAAITRRMPDRFFPAGANGELIDETTHFGMIQGGVDPDKIPYRQWVGPLLHWMPFILVLMLCLLAMTYIVHRQWTVHEQLRYPLASVADSLIAQGDNRPGGSIFRNRLFWVGFAFVCGYMLLRYVKLWFPHNMPSFPSSYSLNWGKLFPSMGPANAGMFQLSWMQISFAMIGIAYLVSTDVSLTVGLTAPLGSLIAVQYYLVSGKPMSAGNLDIFRAGGFMAFGIILAYTGRSYYFPILLKALLPGRKGAEKDPGGVWAARLFLIGYVALIFIVASFNVDLLVAWLIVTFLLLIFLVVTRLLCETGVPTVVPGFSLPGVLTGLFGAGAIGAAPIMFLMLLSSTMVGPRTASLAMPYVATGLKLLDDNKVNLRKFVVVAKVAIIVALVAGFASMLWISYVHGQGNLLKGERAVWNRGVNQVLSLMDFGQLEASEAAHGFGRLKLIQADMGTVGLVLGGLGAVLLCYMMRFRFAKWPIHPLFFVIAGTGAANSTWLCFLLGWAITSAIVKVGGGKVYRSAKPLFIGLISGEFMGIALMVVSGVVYYMVKGEPPPIHMWRL